MMRSAVKTRLLKIKFRLTYRGKLSEPASVAKAAEFLGLDAKHSRELLLFILAEALFGKDKAGRKPFSHKWGTTQLERLGLDALEYRDMSDAEAADVLFAKCNGKYQSAEVIRRMLPEARWAVERMNWDPEPPDGWEPPEPDYDDD
jgi:hypothetical protein